MSFKSQLKSQFKSLFKSAFAGVAAWYYDFDGNSYVNMPSYIPPAAWFIEAEYFVSNLSSTGTIIGGDESSENSIVIDVLNTESVRFFAFNGTSVQTILTSSLAAFIGEVVTIRCEYDSGTAKLMVNGVEVDSDSWSLSGNEEISNIGSRNSAGVSEAVGRISNVNLNADRLYRINEGKGSSTTIDSIAGQNGTPINFIDANWKI